MYRHISIYKLKAPVTTDDKVRFVGYLEEATASCELVVASEVGVAEQMAGEDAARDGVAFAPSPEGAPLFGDIVQIVDFATRDDADAYPAHSAHRELFAKTSALVDRVFAIDYPLIRAPR